MTIARVEQLFALACSTTHEEEARTAALAGVRLMRKNGFKVVDTLSRQPPETPRWDDFFERSRREAEQRRRDIDDFAAAARASRRAERPPRRAPKNGRWCDAAHFGRCDGCGERIEKGDRMYVVATGDDVEHWCGRH